LNGMQMYIFPLFQQNGAETFCDTSETIISAEADLNVNRPDSEIFPQPK
jgi:hypothetical protein